MAHAHWSVLIVIVSHNSESKTFMFDLGLENRSYLIIYALYFCNTNS